MKTKEELIEWIDNATYEQLLEQIRFAPIGDPKFSDYDLYDYYVKRMASLKEEIGHGQAVQASKNIGWDL